MLRALVLLTVTVPLSVQAAAQTSIDLRILRRYEVPHMPGASRAYAMADISGDGRTDVYISKGGGGGVDQLLLACPGGGYLATPELKDIGYPSVDVEIADLDGDTDLDIVTVAPRDGTGCETSRVLINDGRGHFQAAARLPAMSCGQALAVGDVDGNGLPDLFIGRAGDPNLLLFNTNGFFAEIQGRLPVIPSAVTSAVMLDADADHDLDIAVAQEDGAPVLLLNDGTGRFTVSTTFCFPDDPLPASAVAAGDFDRNGFVDLAFAGHQHGTLARQSRIMWNLGGCFRIEPLSQVQVETNSMCAADLDGDQDLDLVFACVDNGNRAASPLVLVNDGTGRFVVSPWQGRPLFGSTVAAADVDDDGDQDLWVGGSIWDGATYVHVDHWYAGYERQLDGPFNPEIGVMYQLDLTARVARTGAPSTAWLLVGTRYIQPRLPTEFGGLGVDFFTVVPFQIPQNGLLSLQSPWAGRGVVVFQALILPNGGFNGARFTNVVGDAL